MSQPPAGWYQQPDGLQRYWDGERWTEQLAPSAPATPPPPPAATGAGLGVPAGKRNWFMRHKILTGLAAVVAVGIIGSLGSTGGDDGTAAAAPGRPAHSSKQGAHPGAGAEHAAPAKGAPATGKADKPAAAKADKQAAAKADKLVADQPKRLPGLGDKARDGAFEFTVKNLSCGHQSVGTSFMEQKAQGQFCFVKMTVKNIGDNPQMLDGSNQYAFDAKGHKFENDTSAEITLEQNKTFLEDINPGNHIVGTVIFDVPQKTRITRLELHDSAFSGGVKVAVK